MGIAAYGRTATVGSQIDSWHLDRRVGRRLKDKISGLMEKGNKSDDTAIISELDNAVKEAASYALAA